MIDGFNGLGHDPVIGSDHKDNNIGNLCTPRPHGRKSGMTGCIQEGNPPSFRGLNIIGADVLGDSACFSTGNF